MASKTVSRQPSTLLFGEKAQSREHNIVAAKSHPHSTLQMSVDAVKNGPRREKFRAACFGSGSVTMDVVARVGQFWFYT